MEKASEEQRLWDMEIRRDNIPEYLKAFVREYFRPTPIELGQGFCQAVQSAAKGTNNLYNKIMGKDTK